MRTDRLSNSEFVAKAPGGLFWSPPPWRGRVRERGSGRSFGDARIPLTPTLSHKGRGGRKFCVPATRRWSLLVLTGLILAALSHSECRACNVPVFRYALEHWTPDSYEVIVFHRGDLSTPESSLFGLLEKARSYGLSNLEAKRVDVSRAIPNELGGLWQALANPTLPLIVVRYPPSLNIDEPAWTGPLNAENVRALTDSPVRRELVQRLLRGDSAVWLLLECGDKERDDAAASLLEEQSRALEKTLQLPEPAPGDPVLQANPPLKIAFSTLRLPRSEPGEQVLVSVLSNASPQMAPSEPIVFAVIGRGRALPPVAGENISVDKLSYVAEFLTGACSCEAKLMNPGFDLLLRADWSVVSDGAAPEPPLTGLAQFAAEAARRQRCRFPWSRRRHCPWFPIRRGSGLGRNVMVVLIAGVVIVAVGTVLVRGRAKRGNPLS